MGRIIELYKVRCGECESFQQCKEHKNKRASDDVCNGFKRVILGELMEQREPSFRELMAGGGI